MDARKPEHLGVDPSQCFILYICIRVLFFFLCYNKGNHTRDAMFLPVCAHLYRDVSVYPWPVNINTINYIVLCYFYVFICLS